MNETSRRSMDVTSMFVVAWVLATGLILPVPRAFQAQDVVKDFDGNSYRTVTIGRQLWMAENLRSTRSCTGTPIAHDAYAGRQDLVKTYGRLYTEAAARNGEAPSTANPSQVRGICPCGWHLPSDAEWQQLVDFLGGPVVAGGKLKARGTGQWKSPNAGATDESSFTALPGGFRDFEGQYEGLGDRAFFRSATGMRARFVRSDDAAVGAGNIHSRDAASVRCVKDQ